MYTPSTNLSGSYTDDTQVTSEKIVDESGNRIVDELGNTIVSLEEILDTLSPNTPPATENYTPN